MLVLAVTGQTQVAAQSRILETLIGAATGVALNAALGPPVYVRPAADAVSNLTNHLAGLLQAMGEELTDGWSSEQARGWVHHTRELDGPLRSAETALTRGEESLRLNPRRRRVLEGTLSLRAGLAALEHVAVQVRGISRDLADLARTDPELWHIQGSLLANVDRLLREIDPERGADARHVRRR
jgi:hypothetical protein